MNALPQTTNRRLKKIPQVPNVWEGDRRSLSGIGSNLEPENEGNGECIIWVDGSEGFVRAMDVVSPEMGPEAIVRTLLKAIETPHSPGRPARPQKIVVRDREIQFFLRGAIQDLEIAIEYVPELPVIDELFRGFEAMGNYRTPKISAHHERLLKEVATEIWKQAPWKSMADYDILSIELNRWDVGTVYACVMGMLGREYGAILYRSVDSLKRFRSAALLEESVERLEKAFLSQDCWFLNFESKEDHFDLDEDEDEDEEFDLADLPISEIRPIYGSVHPYEGMRPFLDEEEALAVGVAFQAFLRFFKESKQKLAKETVGDIHKSYSISLPSEISPETSVTVKVSTLPTLTAELVEMLEHSELEEQDESEEASVPIREDLVPEDSFLSLGAIPGDLVASLRDRPKIYHQSRDVSFNADVMPVILIQTSRPKAKTLIESIQNAGGLKGVCFNPGEDPFTGTTYDLGILQTGNGDLYLFGEFVSDEPEHIEARQKWNQRCQQTNGCCGLIVAMGVTGSSRGNPQLKDMMALFEARALTSKDLGMGVLQLMPELEF